ncbi:MAG TPA: cyclic pyranopterin monophosphate synthase MoaC [Longimicrobiales bacterium]|nr:cyclic pyranopterin monophosphate synthase MoaC [Longimicrobiales bacterium]
MIPKRPTHLDESGAARMVDVTGKDETLRTAVAEGALRMDPETLAALVEGRTPKGEALAVARIAGIQAGKRADQLIPLCHALPGASVTVELEPDPGIPGVRVRAEARYHGRTGVEMEALTAVSVALLTLYDMCKALDRGMVMEEVRLVRKEGGRSGVWEAPPQG